MIDPAVLLVACLLDLLIADPYSWPHPVKMMGAYIRFFQRITNVHNQKKSHKRCLGYILVISLLLLTAGISISICYLAELIHPVLSFIVQVYLSYTCLSARGLDIEARKVVQAHQDRGLSGARQQVSHIVGRQTDQLSLEEVYTATIETVAENTSDGVIAPLLYLALLGPVGGLLYKAINTLDSTVAYRTERYQELGYASAKIDDLVNWLPARLTAVYMLAAGFFLQLNVKKAFQVLKRDARKHLSPNAGFPEACVAGFLGLQLGGSHTYKGEVIVKPTIGEKEDQVKESHVLTSIRILYLSSALFLVSLLFLLLVV